MKIMVLLSRVPYPLEKGDKLRAYHHIREIAVHHEVILVALNDAPLHPEAINKLSEFCQSVHIIKLSPVRRLWSLFKAVFSGIPFQVAYFYQCAAKKKIISLIKEYKPDHLFCQLIRMAEFVKKIDIPKTLDYQDVFSQGAFRRASTSSFLMKHLLREEYRRLLKYEYRVFSWFENKTIISIPDRDLIPHPDKDEILIVPNGVDTDFYSPLQREKKYDLIFSGNMGYAPNVNSVEFIVNRILPIVHKTKPTVNLLIAGASPTHKVLALQSEMVHISGWVEDMRECYASAKIFIAPMQIGTGLQNKLLEAMAMKIPCITSSLANNPLGTIHDHDILVGKTPEEYAAHIIHLLDDLAKANETGKNGFNFVCSNYSWESQTKKLVDVFERRK